MGRGSLVPSGDSRVWHSARELSLHGQELCTHEGHQDWGLQSVAGDGSYVTVGGCGRSAGVETQVRRSPPCSDGCPYRGEEKQTLSFFLLLPFLLSRGELIVLTTLHTSSGHTCVHAQSHPQANVRDSMWRSWAPESVISFCRGVRD